MKFNPHPYQQRAIDFVIEKPYCGLFLGMGLGKSAITLTAIDRLLNDYCAVTKVLVVAPKSVARNTWVNEVAKWDHLSGLRMSVVMGTESQRRKALETEADIYVTNRDAVTWLVRFCLTSPGGWPFDMLVLDESSSFKNFQSKRWKAVWKVRPLINRIVLLTGTPAPNGLPDLWAQIKLLDRGDRLGPFIGGFRSRWFHAGARSGSVVYEWLPNKGAREDIARKISDICLSMRAEDYLEMPMLIDGGMQIELPELERYKRFERDNIMTLPDGEDIVAVTAVSLTNKLLQFASGAVYDEDHVWHQVSSAKDEALSDLLEQTDEPVLVFYNYRHELIRIQELHPDAVPFAGEPEILEDWNAGKIRVMLCHPASVGYGLNLQEGGRIIVWFSPTWNLELYEQANARLNRQGQTKPVIVYHLVCKDTMDEVVMGALRRKSDTQTSVLNYIKKLRRNIANT